MMLLRSILLLILLTIIPRGQLEYADDEYEDDDPTGGSAQTIVRQSRRPSHTIGFDGPPVFIRKPRPKQMNPVYLRELLGDHFDPRYMSETEPPVLQETEGEISENRFQIQKLKSELRKFNLTKELVDAGIPREAFDSVRKWFFKRGSCPLVHTWQNKGPLFWPPWIRHSDCLERYTFCSWPNGMHCVPATNNGLTVLRWQCKERKRKGKKPTRWASDQSSGVRLPGKRRTRMKCQWIQVNYPITSDCMCTC